MRAPVQLIERELLAEGLSLSIFEDLQGDGLIIAKPRIAASSAA
jgi:hypothetical protein